MAMTLGSRIEGSSIPPQPTMYLPNKNILPSCFPQCHSIVLEIKVGVSDIVQKKKISKYSRNQASYCRKQGPSEKTDLYRLCQQTLCRRSRGKQLCDPTEICLEELICSPWQGRQVVGFWEIAQGFKLCHSQRHPRKTGPATSRSAVSAANGIQKASRMCSG